MFHEFREVYGCRRITRELNNRGIACSVGFIASVMKELGLVTVQPRAYKVTTVRGEGDIYPSESPWVLFLVFYEGTGWSPRLL